MNPDIQTAETKKATSKRLCNADGNPRYKIFFTRLISTLEGKNFFMYLDSFLWSLR